MKPVLRLLALFVSGVLFIPSGAAADPIKVHVSILPQKYFVERIAGDLAVVDVLVKPGKSPATYSPAPAQVKKLAAADIYFRIGVPFENGFFHKIEGIADNIRVADTRTGIPLRAMEAHDHHDEHDGEHHDGNDAEENHEHEAEHGHEAEEAHGHKTKKADGHGADDHTGKDPHIWMSPVLVKQQAAFMAETLAETDPPNAGVYQKNYQSFAADLDRLHKDIKTRLTPLKGENLFVFHPSFGYFTDAYGLHQIPVETAGKAPKGKELSAIIKKAKQEKARIIFVQPQFDRHAAQNIARAINGTVVSINPLAYDYMANMKAIADTIADALTKD